MEDGRIPKDTLCGELVSGARHVSSPALWDALESAPTTDHNNWRQVVWSDMGGLHIDEKIVGLLISQWLPCPLAIWNLLFGMAILLNLDTKAEEERNELWT